jgi:hypothetical protein
VIPLCHIETVTWPQNGVVLCGGGIVGVAGDWRQTPRTVLPEDVHLFVVDLVGHLFANTRLLHFAETN